MRVRFSGVDLPDIKTKSVAIGPEQPGVHSAVTALFRRLHAEDSSFKFAGVHIAASDGFQVYSRSALLESLFTSAINCRAELKGTKFDRREEVGRFAQANEGFYEISEPGSGIFTSWFPLRKDCVRSVEAF
jgi:hypothetical protein